jgi:putative FmdB family regulatory protein
MPTYEYLCRGCGHGFDEFQMMSDKPLVKCPKCGKRRLQRLLGTGAGIIFKGSGFYETDYRKKTGTPPKKDAESSSESKSGESKSPESKPAEPKPAPKKDSKKKDG